MIIIPAFQAGDAGLIPATRSIKDLSRLSGLIYICVIISTQAPVAQLDRATVF